MIELTLPYPPTVNTYWRHAAINGRAQVYVSKDGKAYRATVFGAVKQRRVPKLLGRLNVTVRVFPPDRRARDLDNVLKALLDAMAHAGCYENDCQIDQLHVVRMQPHGAGQVMVTIAEIGDLATVVDDLDGRYQLQPPIRALVTAEKPF